MKALEKAAQDRLDTKTGIPVTAAAATPEPAPSTATKSELTLEPIAATAAPPAAASAALTAQAARVRSPPAPHGAPAAPVAPPREPAEAATVVRAGQRATSGSPLTYLRDRPLVAFGILVTLFVIGYGIYVYIELNPGLFARQAPRPAPSPAPIAQARAPVPAPVAGASSPALAPTPPAPVPLVSLLPPLQEPAGKEKPAPPISPVPPAAIKSAGPAAAQAIVLPAPAPAPPPRDTIKVISGSATPTVDPVLADAYGALTAGNLESSQRLYNQLLRNDPRNVEALLGLAAIAARQNDRDAATRHYVKILELDPRNTLAQAGLIGIVGRADPLAAETRVKQLIARDPSVAYLHFTLGNSYVDQNRWPDAQQAYFQAHHLQPGNPDYAYNLAVALEHIGQARPALDYYRRAVQLATAQGRANFSLAAAQERVARLEKNIQ